MFHGDCFGLLCLYEYVWVPNLAKGGGFTISGSLPTNGPNFYTLFSYFDTIYCMFLGMIYNLCVILPN